MKELDVNLIFEEMLFQIEEADRLLQIRSILKNSSKNNQETNKKNDQG